MIVVHLNKEIQLKHLDLIYKQILIVHKVVDWILATVVIIVIHMFNH